MLLAKSREKARNNETKVREGLNKPLKSFCSFPPSIDSLSVSALKEDAAYLDEVALLLPSFASIFYRPHIKVNYSDSLLRSEEAPSISNSAFLLTEKDTSLWKKKKDGHYAPEYVHYEESIDDKATYENYFIIDAFNYLYNLLEGYEMDYLPALSMASGDTLVKEGSEEEALFVKIASLRRKMERLKNASLYKELGDHTRSDRRVYPTNILLKDPNYGRIYRFYLSRISLNLDNQEEEALTYSYLPLILRALKKKGFYLFSGSRKDLRFIFKKENWLIEMNVYPSRGLIGFLSKETSSDSSYAKWLYFNKGYRYTGKCDCPYMDEDMSVLSVYSLSSIDKKGRLEDEFASLDDETLIKRFLSSLTKSVRASEKMYSSFCPVCNSKLIVKKNGDYRCEGCGSIYSFYLKRGKSYCWIKKEGDKEHE